MASTIKPQPKTPIYLTAPQNKFPLAHFHSICFEGTPLLLHHNNTTYPNNKFNHNDPSKNTNSVQKLRAFLAAFVITTSKNTNSTQSAFLTKTAADFLNSPDAILKHLSSPLDSILTKLAKQCNSPSLKISPKASLNLNELAAAALDARRLEFAHSLASVAAALTCEAFRQNTSFLFPANKSETASKSQQILQSLLSQSTLCTKRSQTHFPVLEKLCLFHDSARKEINLFAEFVEDRLNHPIDLNDGFSNDLSFKEMRMRRDHMADHLDLLSSASLARIDLYEENTPKLSKWEGENTQKPCLSQKLTETISVLSFEAFAAFLRLNTQQNEKKKKVEEIQKRKEAKAKELKRSGNSSERETILARKSALGLAPKTAAFMEHFAPFQSSQQLEAHAQFIAQLARPEPPRCERLRTPRGTRDIPPALAAVREKAFEKMRRVFRRYGAVALDTPAIEKREVLMEKYGEDSKLIFDLKEHGGEPLSLRYDLTVPFARHVAANRLPEIKRYQIGKVYRRDAPAVSRGKFREFYQCDFDIAGHFGRMLPEAETIAICADLLGELDLGPFVIKVNHRVLLDRVMEVSGVPCDKFRAICSAIDKLDKQPWQSVCDEMVFEKGVDLAVANKIRDCIFSKGPFSELAQSLRAKLGRVASVERAIGDVEALFDYLRSYGCAEAVTFDLSLARGLDYYTGVIFEAVLTGTERSASVAGGGRYDGLIKSFAGYDLPAVGVSIGVERILAILETQKELFRGVGESATEVWVASAEPGFEREKIELCAFLRVNGVRSEYSLRPNDSPQEQINACKKKRIPFMAFLQKGRMIQLKTVESKSSEYVGKREIVERVKTRRREES